jgi:hypothetical protein
MQKSCSDEALPAWPFLLPDSLYAALVAALRMLHVSTAHADPLLLLLLLLPLLHR